MQVGPCRWNRDRFQLAVASATTVCVVWLLDINLGDGASGPVLVAGVWAFLVVFLLVVAAERVDG